MSIILHKKYIKNNLSNLNSETFNQEYIICLNNQNIYNHVNQYCLKNTSYSNILNKIIDFENKNKPIFNYDIIDKINYNQFEYQKLILKWMSYIENNINRKIKYHPFDINFFGVVDCVKAVEDYFKNRKKGHLSIVSSIAGYRGLPNSSGYGPSKAALTNFTESIYFDFKKYNISISLISPGFIKTPMTDTNEFPMPFIKSPEFAAERIFDGIVKKNNFEIHFPKALTLLLKFFRILPYKIYLYL